MTTQNLLQGEWIVIRSQVYTGSEWELYETFENWSRSWTFQLAERCGSELWGTLRERSKGYKGCKESQTTYIYSPQERTLVVDRSTYLEDGFCDICEEDVFAIEPTEDSTSEEPRYYLSLQNEADCPPPYFRYILQKNEGDSKAPSINEQNLIKWNKIRNL